MKATLNIRYMVKNERELTLLKKGDKVYKKGKEEKILLCL